MEYFGSPIRDILNAEKGLEMRLGELSAITIYPLTVITSFRSHDLYV